MNIKTKPTQTIMLSTAESFLSNALHVKQTYMSGNIRMLPSLSSTKATITKFICLYFNNLICMKKANII